MKSIRSRQIKNPLKAKRIGQTDIDKYQNIDQLLLLSHGVRLLIYLYFGDSKPAAVTDSN
jgi:hypothetical protein